MNSSLLLRAGGLAALIALNPAAWPADDSPQAWGRCGWSEFPRASELDFSPVQGDRQDLPANLEARELDADANTVSLRGETRVTRGDQRLQAGRMTYDRQAQVFTAEDYLRFDQSAFTVFGDRGYYDVQNEQLALERARYYYYPRHAQGRAADVVIFGDEQAVFEDVDYSTCNPGREVWKLSAGELKLDRETGRGEARDVVLRLKDTPIFYSPFLSFPIDDRRKSGFLLPTIGDSERHGFDLTLPWYWNIAPDRDATIIPRYMEDRGLMMGGEFRYLNPTNGGVLLGTYLPNDDKYKDGGRDRWSVAVRHSGRPLRGLERWNLRVDYNRVSDKDYLVDFGNSLRFSSVANLPQSGELRYLGGPWWAMLKLQKFQTVDRAIAKRNRPYEQLPKLEVRGLWPRAAYGLTLHLEAEATSFEHQDNVDGERLHFKPGISLPINRRWGFFVPKASLWYSGYSLRNNDLSDDDSPAVAAPMLSLDGGLTFERPMRFGGEALVHTLEPRLFYLYVPRQGQDQLPDFDSANISENFTALFQDNRFVGRDRLGDANQLTASVTTRFLENGRERALLGVGQNFYFRNLDVTLDPDDASFTRNYSDVFLVGRADLRWGLSLQSSLQWDPKESRTERARVGIQLNPRRGQLFNFSYRFTRSDLEQTEASFMWPLAPDWSLLGRWWYSFDKKRTLEALAGLEYHSCCWAFRLAARNWRDGPDDPESFQSVYAELELKGLAGLGLNMRDIFADSISGYENNRLR